MKNKQSSQNVIAMCTNIREVELPEGESTFWIFTFPNARWFEYDKIFI